MKFIELLCQRRSIRDYKKEKISKEVLDEIIMAGLLSPSGRNIQSTSFVAVDDKEVLAALSEARVCSAQMLNHASAAIIVIGDTSKSDVWIEDACITMTNMQLNATDLGAGSCWIQIRNRDSVKNNSSSIFIKELLNIPDNYEVEAILSLGIIKDPKKPHLRSEADLKRVHYNKY